MPHKGKYNQEIVERISALLSDGNTDTDTCALSGITAETFYTWIKTKPEFSEMVSCARGIARQRAVEAYQSAMGKSEETTDTAEIFQETRLDKNGQPYTYIRKTQSKSVKKSPPDWRAASDYLKRRDPQNWAETYIIKVTPEQGEILKRFGLTPGDAFERLIQNLSQVNSDSD